MMTELPKAFDSLNHNFYSKKLEAYGLDNNAVSFREATQQIGFNVAK